MFHKKLNYWYLENQRDLPWRKTKNPYHIWLSEIMLQQTRIEQGMPYYLKFVDEFPTVKDLADASEEKVLKMWQGLGYYSRARNLHATAKHVAYTLNGVFPNTHAELIKLKGIGDYTASAIASFCFGEVQPVIDGNVYRVLSRYLGIHKPINESSSLNEYKQIAYQLIDKKNPGDFNQALMEYGAVQCKPRNPNCDTCVFNDSCYALKENMIQELPIKLKKIKIKKRYFNYIVYIAGNETSLEKRIGKGIWQNLYQFPLIESDKELSINEIKAFEEFNETHSMTLYNEKSIVHKLSHQHLYVRFWIVETSKISKNRIAISELPKYPVPILIQKFIEAFKF